MNKPRVPSLGQARLVAFITTILALLIYYLAPLKLVVLTPHKDLEPALYSDDHMGGKSEVRWLSYENTRWECIKKRSDAGYPVCGASFHVKNSESGTLDFSVYDFVYLYLSGGETIEKIRMHIRNHNPLYSTIDDVPSQKPNSVVFKKNEFKDQRIKINLNEFNVGDWWLEQNDIPRNLIAREFDRVSSFSLETVGAPLFDQSQTLHFDKLVIVGRWISPDIFYFTIISIWVIILGVDSFKQIYHFYRRSVVDSNRVKYLTNYANTLQKESDKYRELSTVDPLTGISNRAGFASKVERVLSGRRGDTNIGLIVFDIDYFKKINDTFGHDVGDDILKSLANVVAVSLREDDTFARWGGEEFVILLVMGTENNIAQIGEKIRQIVQAQKFGFDGSQNITISLGATTFHRDESFEKAFKRADNALYQAKSNGRNCLVVV